MDEINIGDEIVFNITGNHNIGYTKGEKYIGTVLSRDHRSRLYVRTIGMPRACIDERDVEVGSSSLLIPTHQKGKNLERDLAFLFSILLISNE